MTGLPPATPLTAERRSGVLLHPSSLPGAHGSGDFGASARDFVNWLAAAGQGLWQVLPLNPIGSGHSPYMSPSAFAGNPLLIDPQALVERGWLRAGELPAFDTQRVDYGRVIPHRMALLRAAAEGFFATGTAGTARAEFDAFVEREAHWLEDYALFMAIDSRHAGRLWLDWEPELVRRDPAAIAAARRELAHDLAFWRFAQWQFHAQWRALRAYANQRGVRVIGDLPIFVALHSADVWANPGLFHLDASLRPSVVAGVPPDYFSATGQLWGNPLYRWEAHRAQRFEWWIRRMAACVEQADIVRIDHFRGFCAYWEIPATAPTAVDGRWVPGPGTEFFDAIRGALGTLPVIAEDLGVITPDVTELRERFGLPGMRVLHFAFGGDAHNAYLPHQCSVDSVLYTGTHDNDTTRGWFQSAPARERAFAQIYLSRDGREIHWDLIHLASQSVAAMAVYPLQDVLGLGTQARMNVPGRPDGNWAWRFEWSQMPDWPAKRLRAMAAVHGRNGLSLDGVI